MDLEIVSELNGYNTDKLNFPKEREKLQNRMKFLLKGEMGEDMKNVLEGKIQVKLTHKEKIKYKWRNFINNIIKIINKF